jgi:hypothetical protein
MSLQGPLITHPMAGPSPDTRQHTLIPPTGTRHGTSQATMVLDNTLESRWNLERLRFHSAR